MYIKNEIFAVYGSKIFAMRNLCKRSATFELKRVKRTLNVPQKMYIAFADSLDVI